jgi:hypothetical protein
LDGFPKEFHTAQQRSKKPAVPGVTYNLVPRNAASKIFTAWWNRNSGKDQDVKLDHEYILGIQETTQGSKKTVFFYKACRLENESRYTVTVPKNVGGNKIEHVKKEIISKFSNNLRAIPKKEHPSLAN